uniref:Transposase (putative) gypsy type domain-containing protein n=1 Tax=Tanacetum cinerariifolium TaxID=118510 RepID=A0A6L2K1R2_TANCI|nr:hypothetical protein [Tanacetum cinerariifolium]
MSVKYSITIKTCELFEEEFNDFLTLYPIPHVYHVILPKSNQTIFDAPPGYVRLYTHLFSLVNLRLPLIKFFCNVLEYFQVHISRINPFGCAKLNTSVVMCKGYGCVPTVELSRGAFHWLRYWFPLHVVIIKPLRADEEHVLQPDEVMTDSGGSLKPELFVVHLGSVTIWIKDMKCKTKGGSSMPPVKRKLTSGSSNSHATCAKTSISKDDVPFLTVSDDAKLEAVKLSLQKEVDDVKRDRMEVVSKVFPCVVMELIYNDDLCSLVGRLVSSSFFYERCKAFKQVAGMKEPFDLSKVKGYHPSFKNEHNQASNDLDMANFPWLSEFVANPSAPVKVLPSKKPPTLQRPAPSKTQALVASSPKATPSSVLGFNPMSPLADAFFVKPLSSQQIAASLEDKLDIRMNRFEKSLNDMKASFITPTAPIKAVEEIAAALEDKLDIRMNRFEKSLNEMKNSLATPTAPLKAVTEVCVTWRIKP